MAVKMVVAGAVSSKPKVEKLSVRKSRAGVSKPEEERGEVAETPSLGALMNRESLSFTASSSMVQYYKLRFVLEAAVGFEGGFGRNWRRPSASIKLAVAWSF